MIVNLEERLSDSPFVESVMHGFTASAASVIRPAASCWHMVFVKENGRTFAIIAGPLTTSGLVSWGKGGEILWIKFKLGIFMPHLPARKLIDKETNLPGVTHDKFWLHNSYRELPDFENADTFVKHLIKEELLANDPLIDEVLKGGAPDVSARTLRHRFLKATGMSRSYLKQMIRAQKAAALLEQGVPIMDVMFELGYYDQPHLNRSLKQFIGYTPGQILRANGNNLVIS